MAIEEAMKYSVALFGIHLFFYFLSCKILNSACGEVLSIQL